MGIEKVGETGMTDIIDSNKIINIQHSYKTQQSYSMQTTTFTLD